MHVFSCSITLGPLDIINLYTIKHLYFPLLHVAATIILTQQSPKVSDLGWGFEPGDGSFLKPTQYPSATPNTGKIISNNLAG